MDINEIMAFIQDNHADLSNLIDSQRMSVSNSPFIKILHSRHLVPFWKQRTNNNYFFIVHFDENLKENLNFESINNNLSNITECLKRYNSISVDEHFNILNQEYIDLNENIITQISNDTKVVFFFGAEGIEMAVRGKIIDRINYFYNEVDMLSFAKKYRIDDLQKCLKDYEKHIKDPGINGVFFASEHNVRRVVTGTFPRNILHNKPEKILRDNLIAYLNTNTQHTFSKENELNNQRELDLYAEVDGKKYLIEVKWLGQSINDEEDGLSKKVTDHSARGGVTQTLEYIKHLIEDMNYNLHCGYLCVFDVREVKNQINYRNFNFIGEDLEKYYRDNFIKLEEISLDRN
ncbi:hypothetical protein P2W68_01455 [Chryseobacterium arthrosphaerae]|uniref:hypothetical protein n=1 Tax=Chryseobacterium arthrosphaerae TaxID=651561 RepID=UPI0023E1007F|nr:hypothetical protein [Chryseobacterium arthrosphaerae]WES98291.1 hypothetical protein P2W68_01455 [Chryseobacterium arthrosphaerae]